jgi:hypothetical protein
VNRLQWDEVEAELSGLMRHIEQALSGQSAAVVRLLHEALSLRNVTMYRAAYERLVKLHNKRADLARRTELLGKLEIPAPAWAAAIRNRTAPHSGRDLPGDAEEAWLWRQLHDELEARAKVSLPALQKEIARFQKDLQATTAELVDRRAWASQVRRTTLVQRQSLIGWLNTVRRIGKGTGKRVPRLRAEARSKMAESRTAVPVWIMPLSRVVESFTPGSTRFDVVIIDEASQSDVMGLLAFYLGRQVIVVGDHEPVSPDAVGERLDETQHLIDEHLQGIPNADLYDGKQSVYDLAMQSFGGTICLREHFRCVPDIIQFSNHLSYDGKIKPR